MVTPTVPLKVNEDPSIEVEVLYEIVPSNESTFYTSSTLGSATKPTSGEWVYLSTIRRYISLPADVVWAGTVITVSCHLGPCPDPPIEFFQRGSAEIGIDQSGNLYGSESDKAQFPFFQEDE